MKHLRYIACDTAFASLCVVKHCPFYHILLLPSVQAIENCILRFEVIKVHEETQTRRERESKKESVWIKKSEKTKD